MTQSRAFAKVLILLSFLTLNFSFFSSAARADDDDNPATLGGIWKDLEMAKLNPRKVDSHVIDRFEPEEIRKNLVFDRESGTLWFSKGSKPIESIQVFSTKTYLRGVSSIGTNFENAGMLTVANLELSHDPEKIYPLGKDSLMVLGRDPDNNNFSKYSIVRKTSRNNYSMVTKSLPEYFYATDGAGSLGEMFFSIPGQLDVRTVFSTKKGYLQPQVSMPGEMLQVGKMLYVVEKNNMNVENDDNFVAINLTTGEANRLASKPEDFYRHRLKSIEYLYGANKVAVSESFQDNVLITNEKTAAIEEVIKIPTGRPNALASMGRCLIVASEYSSNEKETPFIYFYDITQSPAKVVDVWDTSSAGLDLRTIRKIAVNPANGTVFARSSMLPFASREPNAVVALYDKAQTAQKYCYQNW